MKIFEAGFIKHDAWSDLISSGFSAIGIDQKTRDLAQPVIDTTKSLLPKGGAVPETSGGIAAEAIPQATGWAFQSSMNPYLVIGGIALIGLAGFYFYKKG